MRFPILRRGGAIALTFLLGLLAGANAPARGDSAPDTKSPGRLEFVGKNAFATANGVFHEWRVVESEVDPLAIADSYAVVEVYLESVDTGSGRRDDHLRNPDFFEVETYPVARVRVHSARPLGQTEAGRPRFSARFDIDLHGVQKSLEGEVVLVGDNPVAFEGSLVVDRMDFGVGPPPSRWNPMAVKAEIPIRFRIELEGA